MSCDNELTMKEQRLFKIGIAMGIVGGMITNLWAAYYVKFIEAVMPSNIIGTMAGLVGGTILIILIVFSLVRDTEKKNS